MATPPAWSSTIRFVKPTDPVSSSVVNSPLTTLASRTDYLKTIVEGITANEFNYLANVAVADSTEAGNVVYWNSATNKFDKGLAAWDDVLLNSDGTLKPAESAVVAGILAYKHTTGTGSVVLGGYIRSFSASSIIALFGTASPAKGVYYLSSSVAGTVTLTTPPLAILTVQYCGNGDILIPTVRFEHSTHDHKRYDLKDTMWLAANITNFPDYPIPAGATYGYNYEAAGEETIKEIFTLYPGIGAFTYVTTGANIPVATVFINENNIWWTDGSAPADDVYMYLTAPNSHGPNIVRAIKSDTPDVLDITLVNGLAAVNKKNWVESTANAGFQVVKAIGNDNTVEYGEVVEKIIVGDGIAITNHTGSEGQGVVSIGLEEFSSKYIDADIVNLNNALEVTVDGAIYTAFPSLRTSSMLATAPASIWTSGSKTVAIWLWVRGLQGGGYPIPDITCEVTVYPQALTAGVALPTTTSTYLLGYAGSTANDMYYLLETALASRVAVTSGALVQYKLTLNNTGAFDVLILRQGIKIYTS
jgi:hypothetical protein